jgi:hypothetical protein
MYSLFAQLAFILHWPTDSAWLLANHGRDVDKSGPALTNGAGLSLVTFRLFGAIHAPALVACHVFKIFDRLLAKNPPTSLATSAWEVCL